MTGKSPAEQLFIGLISGTSMDGIDAVLVHIGASQCTMRGARGHAYPADLRKALLHASRNPSQCSVDELGHLDHWVAESFRDAALVLLRDLGVAASDVTAIGSHGQTIRHQPRADKPFTVQIGDPNIIAAGTGVATVADFRRRDMALGGEGAPLAPAFHQWLLSDAATDRVVLNLGGFANITSLPASARDVVGFDTGPGNSLMDLWCARHCDAPFDEKGNWAASGTPSEELLEQMLVDPYFEAAPPKSTGFEYFNSAWLERHLQVAQQLPAQDVQATLAELTARSVSSAIDRYAASTGEVVLCGGGTHNDYLVSRLAAAMPDRQLRDTADFGIAADWIEAAAFAWLASRYMDALPGNLPAVTGASEAAVLGACYPGTR